jgi:hypothetical protein
MGSLRRTTRFPENRDDAGDSWACRASSSLNFPSYVYNDIIKLEDDA